MLMAEETVLQRTRSAATCDGREETLTFEHGDVDVGQAGCLTDDQSVD